MPSLLLVQRLLRLPRAATRRAYPGAPPGRSPPRPPGAPHLETSPLQTLQAPAFGGPARARPIIPRGGHWESTEGALADAQSLRTTLPLSLPQSLCLQGGAPSPPGHQPEYGRVPSEWPRVVWTSLESSREGTYVPAHTFGHGPVGPRARAGLFWLPPGSSLFGRPRGAEVPRPMQAGGICGRPEARLGCLPDPVHIPAEAGGWERPTPARITFMPIVASGGSQEAG